MWSKNRKKIVVVGTFGYGISGLDGQTIKTQNVYKLLQERATGCKLKKVDTLEIKHSLKKAMLALWYIVSCTDLIIMPADNSQAVLFPACYILSKIFKFNIVNICIGGWQYEFFVGGTRWKPHKMSMKMSKKIKLYMPEMHIVEKDLRGKLGFDNTKVFPNFRFFKQFSAVPTVPSTHLRCAFMARVNKKKGYPDLFRAFSILNERGCKARLSIFGSIAEEDKTDFYEGIKTVPNVEYGGEVESSKVFETLSKFDVLLLPTHYYTEGFPGSVLDAYIAGIPVIVSEWRHSHEFVENGRTGVIYKFGDEGDLLAESIQYLDCHRDLLNEMKINAHNASAQYSADAAWETIKDVFV